jgi:hypothetical protein
VHAGGRAIGRVQLHNQCQDIGRQLDQLGCFPRIVRLLCTLQQCGCLAQESMSTVYHHAPFIIVLHALSRSVDPGQQSPATPSQSRSRWRDIRSASSANGCWIRQRQTRSGTAVGTTLALTPLSGFRVEEPSKSSAQTRHRHQQALAGHLGFLSGAVAVVADTVGRMSEGKT